jgi:hypothetical protein
MRRLGAQSDWEKPLAIRKAHAAPTKEFFVRMITKDIDLEDCILDLIDNCLDGARRSSANAPEATRYAGFAARIEVTSERFKIEDNCGGIGVDQAIDYAFHFGRRKDAPPGDHAIGLYGIGMKRAIFKMGNAISIRSSTAEDSFRTDIDVDAWLAKPSLKAADGTLQEDWDFDLDEASPLEHPGTQIAIEQLNPEVARQFADPAFRNGLIRIVSRDYSQFIAKGFSITVNDTPVVGFRFAVREGADIKPLRTAYVDETGVRVEIIAGMAGPPPDDLGPTERRPEADYYGWFVLCNDRVIVASDKSEQTGWGEGGGPLWHFQYNGFLGIVDFVAEDPTLLPWRTTKRDVDDTNPTYRRALVKMREAARAWVKYTNDRRVDIERAKQAEVGAVARSIFAVEPNEALRMPAPPALQKVSYSSIQYSKPVGEIDKAKKLLKRPGMSNARLGEATFEYFVKHEGGA